MFPAYATENLYKSSFLEWALFGIPTSFMEEVLVVMKCMHLGAQSSYSVVWWQQDKNGKESMEETEGKSGRVHRGRWKMK